MCYKTLRQIEESLLLDPIFLNLQRNMERFTQPQQRKGREGKDKQEIQVLKHQEIYLSD